MLQPLPKRRRDSDDNVLPLINIVFLLLIFFMVAGALHARPPFDATPPGTEHADDSQPGNAILAVSADGDLALGGKPIEAAALPDALARRDSEDEPLQVQAHRDLRATTLQDLLSDLRRAGVAEVHLLTHHQQP